MAELTSASHPAILELHGISKTFHGVKVLDQVGLRVLPGEVMALLGENGAGKSTLMKIVSGITEADPGGTIRLGGTEVRFTNPRQSVAAGISMIHQDLNLLPGMTVAENLFLGREPLNKFGMIDWPSLDAAARKLLAVVHQAIDPRIPVHRLGVGQQQMVEIARALSLNASLIIMDEPTDSLTDVETEILFDAIRQLRSQGKGIIYISHRLGEIFKICDSVTVLRNGQTVAAEPVAGLDEATLIRQMVGREITDQYPHTPAVEGPVRLRVDHLSAPGVEDISFDVHKGEVVGLAGLMGAGTPELGRTLYGALAARSGSIEVDGERLSLRTPAAGVHAGIAYVPEDRKSEGLIQMHSVLRNMTLTGLARFAWLLGFIVHHRESETVDHYIKAFSIRTSGPDALVATLSGGNQQKVALAKALITKPRILILDEPTRGVDVGVRREIYSLISDLKAEGLAILFISSDLRELLGIADRILVLSRGRLSGVFDRGEATQDAIMQRAVA
ncbi:MAG TPA: sugar ABC transporter ATP-binding protein [Acetobacteraceae bacterium]|nr:sugar ABC transporter ATP-binding protein [Acetobacteraceae bacterium]